MKIASRLSKQVIGRCSAGRRSCRWEAGLVVLALAAILAGEIEGGCEPAYAPRAPHFTPRGEAGHHAVHASEARRISIHLTPSRS